MREVIAAIREGLPQLTECSPGQYCRCAGGAARLSEKRLIFEQLPIGTFPNRALAGYLAYCPTIVL